MFPCIKDNCLKLPVCKLKSTIKCNLVYDYFVDSDPKCIYAELYNILPNTKFIDNENKNIIFLIQHLHIKV